MFVDTKQAFELKGGMLPYTKLKLNSLDVDTIYDHLTVTTKTAPKLFQQMPVILDVTALPSVTSEQLKPIVAMLGDFGLIPFALEGQVMEPIALDNKTFLPLLSQLKTNPSAITSSNEPASTSLVIERNIRSGQQLVHDKGDLIVWGSVSAGAEVMASGNIHVYGRLFGKAMAGMKGCKEARIFAGEFAPELVAIAGIYALVEQMPEDIHGQTSPIQVQLQQDQLLFKRL